MTKKVQNQILYNLNFLKSCGYEYIADINLKSEKKDSFDLPHDLISLSKIVEQCSLCQFSKSRINTVFGLGNSSAKIMFIGDFPSISEDESGTMLDGKYGEMLKNIVNNVLKVPFGDVYFTNIFKCKKGNFELEDDSHHSCIPYLHKQIEIISPKVIVLLGSDTYKYFFDKNESDFKVVYGTFEEYKNMKLMCTYHPSFLVRNPSFKKDVLNDMLKVKTYLES